MALYDSIILEIDNGVLERELRAADLLGDERKVFWRIDGKEVERYRVGFDFYCESHIRTEMANHAEGTGYSVRAGQVAKYRRVAEGLYRVIALNEQEEWLEKEEAPVPSAIAVSSPVKLEDRIACYLENEPFQIFNRKRKSLHPKKPVMGMDARISCYFWPTPAVGYGDTEQRLQGFVARAQRLLGDLQGNALEALALFSEICQWGGVRLPTEDPQVVVDNLCLAAQKSQRSPASMNSAWTKLYAIFYPDDFLIYDSRVATALVSIAESVMADTDLSAFRKAYPSLGVISGRGGSRPRATRTFWSNAYTSWSAQLDANDLAKTVLISLNQRGGHTYSLRQLEAVLFMEGY